MYISIHPYIYIYILICIYIYICVCVCVSERVCVLVGPYRRRDVLPL